MWQRFKQMRESQGGQNRDERQKREQAREEKELAKFAEKYVILNRFYFLRFDFVHCWLVDQQATHLSSICSLL